MNIQNTMIPGMNPVQMKQAMKKLGIKQEEIYAEEVIIKCSDKNIIVKNPQVIKMNMVGQESLQITGDISEQSINRISDEDINTVAEQSNVSKEKAKQKLEETAGDLAEAILQLQNN